MIWCVTLNPSLDTTLLMQEAWQPGFIHSASASMVQAGGKGNNVARAVQALGGPVTAVGPYGGAVGRAIVNLLEEGGIPVLAYPIAGDNRICLTIVGPPGEITEIRAPGPSMRLDQARQILTRLIERVKPADWVTLSGSLPPGLPPTLYAEWVTTLNSRCRGVIVDTSGPALVAAFAAAPTAIVPNLDELGGLQKAVGSSAPREGTHIIVTRGPAGATWRSPEGAERQWVPPLVNAHNTVGAGDVFLGALVHGMHQDDAWARAIPLAIAMAAASVETPDVATFSPARGLELLPLVKEVSNGIG